MMRKEMLQGWVKTLMNIQVPVGLLDQITIPILAVAEEMKAEIKKLMEEEKQGKEDNADADHPVQREDAQPEQL